MGSLQCFHVCVLQSAVLCFEIGNRHIINSFCAHTCFHCDFIDPQKAPRAVSLWKFKVLFFVKHWKWNKFVLWTFWFFSLKNHQKQWALLQFRPVSTCLRTHFLLLDIHTTDFASAHRHTGSCKIIATWITWPVLAKAQPVKIIHPKSIAKGTNCIVFFLQLPANK